MLRWLCTDERAKSLIDPAGISIVGANLASTLTLKFVNVPFPLRLIQCRIGKPIYIRNAHVAMLDLTGSVIAALHADGISIDHDLFLRNGFECEGDLRVVESHIAGNLECDRASLSRAITADGAEIGGSPLALRVRDYASQEEPKWAFTDVCTNQRVRRGDISPSGTGKALLDPGTGKTR